MCPRTGVIIEGCKLDLMDYKGFRFAWVIFWSIFLLELIAVVLHSEAGGVDGQGHILFFCHLLFAI